MIRAHRGGVLGRVAAAIAFHRSPRASYIAAPVGRHLIVILAGAVACAATLDSDRRDYILAHPHGWVEVSIADGHVPQVPETDSEGRLVSFVRPDDCSIEVRLDREPFVYNAVYPTGEQPPYSVKSGFRFPAPVGPALLSIHYAGCDRNGDAVSSTDAQLSIAVEQARVVQVHFDGTELVADPPRDNSVVTLDDLYEAITVARNRLRSGGLRSLIPPTNPFGWRTPIAAQLGHAASRPSATTTRHADAAKDHCERRARRRGEEARLHRAELVRGADEDHVDGGDAAAQRVGRGELHGGGAQTTLTWSAAPAIMHPASESGNERESPNPIVARPYTPTAVSNAAPARSIGGGIQAGSSTWRARRSRAPSSAVRSPADRRRRISSRTSAAAPSRRRRSPRTCRGSCSRAPSCPRARRRGPLGPPPRLGACRAPPRAPARTNASPMRLHCYERPEPRRTRPRCRGGDHVPAERGAGGECERRSPSTPRVTARGKTATRHEARQGMPRARGSRTQTDGVRRSPPHRAAAPRRAACGREKQATPRPRGPDLRGHTIRRRSYASAAAPPTSVSPTSGGTAPARSLRGGLGARQRVDVPGDRCAQHRERRSPRRTGSRGSSRTKAENRGAWLMRGDPCQKRGATS